MRWTVHGERPIYDSPWMSMALVDVEVPGGPRFDHHVVRFPRPATGVVVHDPIQGVLMLWRHRFITNTWGWEIPAGGVDPGETPQQAAAREVREETGYATRTLQHLGSYAPSNGATDQVFHVFTAPGAQRVGEPTDPSESEKIEWVPLDEVRRLIGSGQIYDGLSLTSLLWAFTLGPLS